MKWTAEMVEDCLRVERERRHKRMPDDGILPQYCKDIADKLNEPKQNEAQRKAENDIDWIGAKAFDIMNQPFPVEEWATKTMVMKALSPLHVVPEKATEEMVMAYCGRHNEIWHKSNIVRDGIQALLDHLRGQS